MTPRTRSFTLAVRHHGALTAVALAALLGACSTPPSLNPALEQARARWQAADTDPQLAALAHAESERARDALGRAERAHDDGEPAATVDHLSYLVTRHVLIAQETVRSRAAQAVTAGAAAERDQLRLAGSSRRAERAERQLEGAAAEVARQGEQLNSAERAAVRSADELAAAERDIERQREALAHSESVARAAQAQASERQAQVGTLEDQLRALDARQTERGLVVTLGDLLFDSGQDRLQTEGLRHVDALALFLKRNPLRRAVIEGHADSQGGDASNLDLSDRRAHAVMNRLVLEGVAPERLSAQAFGESRPMADNATAAGRRLNRRVEVVFAAEAADLLRR